MVTLYNRLMLMYRRFLKNLQNPQMTEKGTNDNGYYLPVSQELGNIKMETANFKMKRRSMFLSEKSYDPMKTLLISPETSYECHNIVDICSSLRIQHHKAHSENEALLTISENLYDLIIIDGRKIRKEIDHICHDQLAMNIRIKYKAMNFKIVLYIDRPMTFAEAWENGYDEQWISYSTYALRNYIESYLVNQFTKDVRLRTLSLVFSVFDKFLDCVEILNKDFSIEMVNGTFQRIYNSSLDEIKGLNWFDFHDLPDNKKDLIISELNSKKSWEGFIAYKTDQQILDYSNNVFVNMKPLDGYDSKYMVIINTLLNSSGKSEQSHSFYSNDRDSTATSLTKIRDNFFNSQQISIDSPILKITKIISSIQEISSPLVNYQLQRIIEILSSKDLFNTTVDSLKTDKMSSNLIDGLLSNNATILAQTETRRHSSSLTKRRQTRVNSEVIHDHITHVLAKITKIPEVSETEELGVIDELLEKYRSWSFDILMLEKLTDFKPLRHIGMKVFTQFDLGSVLNIDDKLFQNWLYIIETNYNDNNCYHNSTHAADVLQSSIWFLERQRINEIFDSYDDVISIIAAIIHDLGHPGRTNPFLINSSHSLAVLYNDVAVLENHHASFAFKVTLKDDRINIFKNMHSDDYRSLRHGIIDAVLATEMAKHFEHLTKFVNNIINNKMPIQSTPKIQDHESANSNISSENSALLFSDPENKAIIRRMLIKCSDVNNPTRPFHLCKEWAYRISEEYFSQTDEEIKKGLPVVMPQFNRQTCDIPKSQIYFIDIFLQDMFSAWNDFVDVEELLKNMNSNKDSWKSLSDNVSDSAKTLSEN